MSKHPVSLDPDSDLSTDVDTGIDTVTDADTAAVADSESEASGLPRIRQELEDFQVLEVADGPPPSEADGEHIHLWIEKRGVDTARVADRFASLASVGRGQVGYCGRKDRRAVTRQWFSVPLPRAAESDFLRAVESLEDEGVTLLTARRGRKRLRLGGHRGNAFRLRVRGVTPQQARHASTALEAISQRGLPNRFGAQRFGRHGGNLERGLRMLAGKVPEAVARGGHRRLQRLLISAVQAQVFNDILERRPCPPWQVVEGDIVRVHRSDRLRPVTDPAAEVDRLQRFLISPTAPLFGPKVVVAGGVIADLEAEVLASYGLERFTPGFASADGAPELPKALRPWGERRDLRIPVGTSAETAYVAIEGAREAVADTAAETAGEGAERGDLFLTFQLPPGAYATVLLEELLPRGYEDMGRA